MGEDVKKRIGGVKHRPPPPTEEEKKLQHVVASPLLPGSLAAARLEAKYKLEVDKEEYVIIYKGRWKGEGGHFIESYSAFSPWGAGIAAISPLYIEVERWNAGSNPLAETQREDATHGKTQGATGSNPSGNARP